MFRLSQSTRSPIKSIVLDLWPLYICHWGDIALMYCRRQRPIINNYSVIMTSKIIHLYICMISAFIKTDDDKIGGKDKIWNRPTDVSPGRSKRLRKSDFRTKTEKSLLLFFNSVSSPTIKDNIL